MILGISIRFHIRFFLDSPSSVFAHDFFSWKKSQSIIFLVKYQHKYLIHNNIQEWYFLDCFTRSIIKTIIEASQNRHKASCRIAKLPSRKKYPKIVRHFGHSVPALWATSTLYLVYRCPTLGPRVPIWRAQTDRLIVSDRTPYVLLFLIQLVFFLLFLVCIDIFYILEE